MGTAGQRVLLTINGLGPSFSFVVVIVFYRAAAQSLPNQYNFSFNETSEAEATTDHVTLLRLLYYAALVKSGSVESFIVCLYKYDYFGCFYGSCYEKTFGIGRIAPMHQYIYQRRQGL